MTCKWNQLQ